MKKVQFIILSVLCSVIMGCVNKVATHPVTKPVTTTKSSSKIYFCPKPKVVVKNKYNVEGFGDQKLNWSVNNEGWKIPKHIAFTKAVVGRSGNTLTCYYQWPSAKKPGTYHWMMVDLNPGVNQKIHHYGVHWVSTTPDIYMCNSGAVKTCGFTLR